MLCYDSLISFQPFKNAKTILNSWAMQVQVVNQICPRSRNFPTPSRVYLFCMQIYFFMTEGKQNTRFPLYRESGNCHTLLWWSPCFLSRLSWIWFQVGLQVGDTGGPGRLQYSFPICQNVTLSTIGNFCPRHYPKTEEDPAIRDFFLYLENSIVPLKFLHPAQCSKWVAEHDFSLSVQYVLSNCIFCRKYCSSFYQMIVVFKVVWLMAVSTWEGVSSWLQLLGRGITSLVLMVRLVIKIIKLTQD